MANEIYIPFINPVKFYEVTRANLPKFFTKHFDTFMFQERLYDWQSPDEYCQIWQDDDIINLQFESSFSPIVVNLLKQDGTQIITLPALIGLPNLEIPGLFSFETGMSLAGLQTGCYYLQVILGPSGVNQKILISDCQYISAEPIKNSILMEYWNSIYHEDVIWETGIKMQLRLFGHIGFLEPGRNDEAYRDQKYNRTLLNSRTFRQWPVFFGDEFGLPDDMIDKLNHIWTCDSVYLDNKQFGIADGSKLEFTEIDSSYPKRGVKLMVEEGLNRNSSIFAMGIDTGKRLISTIIVEAKVFGDTSNSGSNNTVPVTNIE